jgi:hypothetical protein
MSLAPVVVTIEPMLNEIEGAISISGSQWSIEFQCLLSTDGGTLEAEWRAVLGSPKRRRYGLTIEGSQ